MLAAIAVVGVVTQAPTAIFLETKLHGNTSSLLDIFTIGLPEELAKAIPIVVVAWIWRQYWHTQTPRDYLFLGAVSGLVFGAAEVVHYFTDVLGSLSGNVNGLVLQDLTIQYVWRFLTDPIDHACWAGITGYFIGLAITGQNRKYSIGLVGIAIAAILHGLNDWNPINSHPAWVVVTLISVLLFLGYARAGAWLPEQAMAAPDGMAVSPEHAQAHPRAQPAPWAAVPPAPPLPGPRPAAMRDEWWQHVPAASAPPAAPAPAPHPAAASHAAATPADRTAPHAATPYNPATAATVVQRKPPVRPWWEQER
jgi:RsiW-degrading membrane proteinase PrsW (M82 family)